MSDSFYGDVVANSTWQDAVAFYPAASGNTSYVYNMGPANILVAYSANTSAPTGTTAGRIVHASSDISGNAAHVWFRSLNGTSTVHLGVV